MLCSYVIRGDRNRGGCRVNSAIGTGECASACLHLLVNSAVEECYDNEPTTMM